VSEPTPAPTCRRCAPRPSTTRPRTSGCSTAPRRGSPTAASPTSTCGRHRRSRAAGTVARQLIVPPNTPGLSQGRSTRRWASGASHTAESCPRGRSCPRLVPARRQGQADEKLARAREALQNPQVHSGQAAGHGHVRGTRPAVAAQAVGCGPGRLRVRPAVRHRAVAFASPSPCTRASASCWPTWPPRSTPPACWCAGRLALEEGAYQNAEARCAKLKAAAPAVWVTERAIQILGAYGYVRSTRSSVAPDSEDSSTIFEGTEQIQQLVISPGHHRPAGRVARQRLRSRGRPAGNGGPPAFCQAA